MIVVTRHSLQDRLLVLRIKEEVSYSLLNNRPKILTDIMVYLRLL